MKNERKLLMATGSKTKIEAWNLLFHTCGIDNVVVSLPEDMGLEHIEVTERDDAEATYFDNALLKAKAYWDKYHVPVLADDSGLEIEKLDKWPGICTARCNGGERGAVSKFIVDKMRDYPDWNDRRCRYCTSAVFMDEFGHKFSCFMYREGFVAKEPAGNGNCVEVIFIPDNGRVPRDDDKHSRVTLGQMNEELRGGQQFQAMCMYPLDADMPKISFVNLMRVMSDTYSLTDKDDLDMDEFRETFKDILDYITIKKLSDFDVRYMFGYPNNPQAMAECMLGL